MIKTARQLKDKVKNLVGDTNLNNKSQTMVRNFIMERFLERISQSEYRDNFILKGGMLVNCTEAYINSTDNEHEKSRLFDLYRYYSENKEALVGYYDRGITIPPTREPGVIHHARLRFIS